MPASMRLDDARLVLRDSGSGSPVFWACSSLRVGAARRDWVLPGGGLAVRAWRAALFGVLSAAALASVSIAREPPPAQATPSALFGDLYSRVQAERLFPDSKTFADAVPKRPPDAILADYRAKAPSSKAALDAFVRQNFVIPREGSTPLPPALVDRKLSLQAHIAALWPVLTRTPRTPELYSSLLPLNWPYVVPGGRFREMYYWDSYFTMLGLVRDGRRDSVVSMTRDFADLIGRYGHIPNGTRTYYLSRSQPPFFYLMVGLTSEDRASAYEKFLPALRAEHGFWMRGAAEVRPGQANEHVVGMPDGSVLNRYWDASPTPRDESYREDVALAAQTTQRPAAELYSDIRAAAESGWDFSSRWFADGKSLASIETTAIVPVDLNSLLFGLEQAIAEGCAKARDEGCVSEFKRRASDRRKSVQRYLWDAGKGRFLDYHWRRGEQLDRPTVAMVYPLFAGLADAEQARAVAAFVASTLLAPGGLLTTANRTGEQWDAPNGWAPHQWIAVAGLNAYGESDLARTIATRWLATVARTYRETGKLLEKYDVQEAVPGGGGEYPVQDGFGWTNGVTREFLALYPDSLAENGRRD